MHEVELTAITRTSHKAPKRIRTSYSTLGTLEPEILQAEATIFRYVSITEAYIDALSSELMSNAMPYSNPLVKILIEEYEIQTTSNWERRHEKFSKIHSIRLKECSEWNKVNAAIEVRNTIAHGLGRLTPLQQKKANIASALSAIGVSIDAGRVRLTLATARTVRDACRAFIRSVDQKCPLG
ncbi:hypothetical protein [Nonomuraea insulae]|uniref:Apea-like HEPN domain-containing protein n=1 Tax=Nonomuraea insulae TaxID=1616787 RepID=A0ABW1D151_9ACTN